MIVITAVTCIPVVFPKIAVIAFRTAVPVVTVIIVIICSALGSVRGIPLISSGFISRNPPGRITPVCTAVYIHYAERKSQHAWRNTRQMACCIQIFCSCPYNYCMNILMKNTCWKPSNLTCNYCSNDDAHTSYYFRTSSYFRTSNYVAICCRGLY